MIDEIEEKILFDFSGVKEVSLMTLKSKELARTRRILTDEERSMRELCEPIKDDPCGEKRAHHRISECFKKVVHGGIDYN